MEKKLRKIPIISLWSPNTYMHTYTHLHQIHTQTHAKEMQYKHKILATQSSESGFLAPTKKTTRHTSIILALGKQQQDPIQPDKLVSSGFSKRPYLKTKQQLRKTYQPLVSVCSLMLLCTRVSVHTHPCVSTHT